MTSQDIEIAFDQTFFADYQTLLRGGATEPFYRAGSPSVIEYRDDFIRSALHEVAHWCVAGVKRRQQDDYGYWYCADGRDQAQQAAFEAVEVLPQAIESVFCEALGIPFTPSIDNLSGEATDPIPFTRAIAGKQGVARTFNRRVIDFTCALRALNL